ncbi:MAG: glycosyltransferase family 39 protein [Spirochaetaceae bacterium]|nr:glycosyltransferase family 39 protein [Spirochaetaceae bacterium]
MSNGDFLPGSDQEGNMLFSVNLLKRGSLSLGPPHAPHAFFWTLEQPGVAPRPVAIEAWNDAADAAYREGRLKVADHHYYLAATTRPAEYVNTFGLGAALAGLPVYAVIDLFVDIATDRSWWWHGAALTASLLTALAAVFVFLAARCFVEPLPAALVALAFGLGSCVWPVSSQALWQHPASTLCLSLGAWFLVRSPERPRTAAWCGAVFGKAVLCRPTTAVSVVCVGAYLLWVDRRRCAAYVLGGLPFLVILIAYNGYYFGSPFVFGQTAASKTIALRDTGSESLWQSSWRESLPGLLISPSRGLLWFSPVLLLGLAGAPAVWRVPRYRPLIPLQAAAALMILVAGKWVDWIGGLTWGYRSIVDTTPFLALLMVPVMERAIAGRRTRAVFAAALVWSMGAQFVGAWSYSVVGWHAMTMAYDDPNHAGVWLWRRPQIGYHLASFATERAQKRRLMAIYADNRKPVLVLPDRARPAAAADERRLLVRELGDPAALQNRADALRTQGRYEEAIDHLAMLRFGLQRYAAALELYRRLAEIEPGNAQTHANLGATLYYLGRTGDAIRSVEHALSLDPALKEARSALDRLREIARQDGQQ